MSDTKPVWQLLQVRKLYNTPLILVGKMWAELVEWGRRSMLGEGHELASAVDFTIPHCVRSIEETVVLIRANPRGMTAGASGAEGLIDRRGTTCKATDHKTWRVRLSSCSPSVH